MKNKSFIMKNLLLTCVILIICLLLIIVFLIKTIKKINLSNKPKTQTIINRFDISKYDLVSFDFKNSEVSYTKTNDTYLILKQTSKTDNLLINNTINKKGFFIKEKQSNYFYKTKYKILIPESYKNKISITNGFSNIKIKNVDNKLELNNNSGKVNINKTTDIDIINVSGDIKIGEVNSSITLDSSIGKLVIKKLTGKCKITTITGDISIKNFNIKDKSNIETTSGDVNIKIDNSSECTITAKNQSGETNIAKSKCIEGNNILNIKNITGNINIK